MLVVDTGYFGMEVIVQKPADACKTFNRLKDSGKNVAAALQFATVD